MGRTVPSTRLAIEDEIKRTWKPYRQGLRPEERKILDQFITYIRLHSDASSLPPIPNINELALISILLELVKRIEKIEKGHGDG